MATLLFSTVISEKYKETSEIISSVEVDKKDIRKKSMKQIMQESFFHGRSWMGTNFIA